jgi:uncharacterized membrane protein YfcA
LNALDHIILFLVSLVANTFSAFSGGGAGLIQFPILLFLGLTFGVALATHKVASVALGIGAALRYLKHSVLERQFILIMLLFGVPGVILGANIILLVPDRVAELALGLLTGGIGLYSVFSNELGQFYRPIHRDKSGWLWGGTILFVLGVLNGSLTSGTGLFVTLWLVIWFGLDYQRAVAYTLTMVGLFWNGSGALTLGLIGNVHWEWIPALFLGSLIGGYLGSHMALHYGNQWIKRVYEVVTLLISIKLLVGH